MLGDLENRLAGFVSDVLSGRSHVSVGLTVTCAFPAGGSPSAVSLIEARPDPGFRLHDIAMTGPPGQPRSRRVLPLGFEGRIAFAHSPAQDNAAGRDAAHSLCLEDLSIVAHALADPACRSGEALAGSAPDPGFRVLGFWPAEASLVSAAAGEIGANLGFAGQAEVWPVGVTRDEGTISATDTAIIALPLLLAVSRSSLPPSGEARITIPVGRVLRLIDPAAGDRASATLAIAVSADVPLAARGTILEGSAAAETGLRLVTPAGGTAEVTYRAPAADPGPAGRTEYVAVHLATADGTRGLFLGSTAIQLVAAP
jgi:hypothetical protein